jgi:Phage integrase family
VNVATDPVISELHRQRRATEWKKFLQKIDREVPAGVEVHIVAARRRPAGAPAASAARVPRARRRGGVPRGLADLPGAGDAAGRPARRRGAVASGAVRVRPHRLRHTYGIELAAAGIDLLALRDLMGHANPETTAARAPGPRNARRRVRAGTGRAVMSALAAVTLRRQERPGSWSALDPAPRAG